MLQLSPCLDTMFTDVPIEDRVQQAAAAGADGFEFWAWREKDLESITSRRAESDIELAAMGGGSGAELTDPTKTAQAVRDIEQSIDVAQEVRCETLIVTVGSEHEALERSKQYESVVTVLASVADAAERANVTLVVEPLNTERDHEGYFLTSSREGHEIVTDVDSTHVKLLFDVYHQQVTEGNILSNIRRYIDDIGHIHIADVPGRHEPGTGELNYANILDAIDETGYDGYVGCELHPIRDSAAVIEEIRLLMDE